VNDGPAGAGRPSYAAPIAAMGVFGIAIGFSAPFLSLVLDSRGYDAVLIGANATATAIAIVIGSALVPMVARRTGLRRLLLGCLAVYVATFLLLWAFDDIASWFVLRFVLGLAGAGLFVGSEAWISRAAPDTSRGRIIGLYATALSAGFASGPLLIPLTGIEGFPPFGAVIALLVVASLPFFLHGRAEPVLGPGKPLAFLRFLRAAPALAVATAMFGLIEFAAFSLLAVFGLRLGFGAAAAVTLLTAVGLGQIAFQVPLGWLADRWDRYAVLKLCALVGVLGIAALPLAGQNFVLATAILFVWGGFVAGLYTLSLVMVGAHYQGPALVGANAGLAMLYGLGAIIGPPAGGAAMQAWQPYGFAALLGAAALLALLVARGRSPWRTAAAG
jgi:MFS family permease